MKTIEKVKGGYRITEGNEVNLLSDAELVKFIKDEELNFSYINGPDDLTEVCPVNLLADNYENIINLYLERHAV